MHIKDKKKVLFIDRDGVIVKEQQVDSYEKIEYIPHVFEALRTISDKEDYLFVMVSNQDGVGTPSFPYESYIGPMERILETLRGERIVFDDINVDFSMPEDDAPTRKPKTAMIDRYRSDEYDMAASFMVGDRLTDMLLAKNMGCRGFLLDKSLDIPDELKSTVALQTDSWLDISAYLAGDESLRIRKTAVRRKTKETDIEVSLALDGTGSGMYTSGIGFLDHMLSQIIRHSRFDIEGRTIGDLEVDEHHTTEDTAIALGEAVMMDDTIAFASIDFSGRPDFIFDVSFTMERIGTFPSELIRHFFRSFSAAAKCNLYLSAREGGDSHHTAEALFKAFARAMRKAVKRIPGDNALPSTKGLL